jgi:2-succinyl-5-enolpyruvyl-6-hydroxy-3-cyclohexene-1-carboxylate synthase
MRLQPIYDIAAICHARGLRDVVVCPGSRCAPLTLSFARQKELTTRTISDERSAAFIALGIAQQTRRAVVLICTSGTAAYNFAPAIAEAYYQRVPLLVLTADRPAEWIGQWDGQTISQQNIYGQHAKRSYQLPQDYDHNDSKWAVQRIINEAISLSTDGKHGPVHVNVPLREPLYPAAGEEITFSNDIRITEKLATRISLPPKTVQTLASQLEQSKKILIVGGQGRLSTNLITALNSFASAGDAVVVGDIISNLHPLPSAVRYTDIFLSQLTPETKQFLSPDLLITIGQSVISKNLKLFLRANKPAVHWHVEDGCADITDPFQSVTTQIIQNPEDFFSVMIKSVNSSEPRKAYVKKWKSLEEKAANMVDEFFRTGTSGEFGVVRTVMNSIPDHTNLHLANSMSVRYANFCGLAENKKGVEVFSNRGTSGIDGCTSTVVGHSLATDTLNTLITGDVAFLYDRNAFWNNYKTPNLRIIVLNNHGGVIFGMIDGPGTTPEADEYFITRQPLSAKHLSEEFGINYTSIKSLVGVDKVLEEFFKPDGHVKILEIESHSKESKEVFLQFKEKIKKTYAA